jgi:hypothetical protein
MIILRGIGGLILHMRRRVVLVAHVNHPQP